MNEVRRFQLKCLMGLAVVAIIVASRVIWASEDSENPRPAEARVSGNIWCGPVARSGSAPIYAIYAELARYVDGGATIVGYSESESADSETFILCGRVRGRSGE